MRIIQNSTDDAQCLQINAGPIRNAQVGTQLMILLMIEIVLAYAKKEKKTVKENYEVDNTDRG